MERLQNNEELSIRNIDFHKIIYYNSKIMTQSIRLDVNREVFSWAVARAGFAPNDVLSKYPKFLQWTSGETFATVKQLKDFSQKFHFPFGYFFLNDIPHAEHLIPFFRASEEESARENLYIQELTSILSERQDWVSEYLRENDAGKNPAVGLYTKENNAKKIKSGILDFLGLEDTWQSKLKNPEQAIKKMISLLEANNVFVTFSSVVNFDTHRPIPVKLCRGFCLIDDFAPFIFVNSSDSKNAQLFTLAHELAHIFISFSAGFGDFGAEEITNDREKLCDKVAAEFLVPEYLLLEKSKSSTDEELCAFFKVSNIVILRRKLDCGLISRDIFFKEYNKLSAYKRSGGSGGDFYKSARNRIGEKFIRCLSNAIIERKITPLEAYRLAGVNGNVFTKLAHGVQS